MDTRRGEAWRVRWGIPASS